jgi:TolB-like protein/DNA-binding winged helix-turn-helix (wHTH) protein/Flp pilus assembly protein TadD
VQTRNSPPEPIRFGEFELDTAAYELRRSGDPVRLERRPMDLLILLVERRGELVSRADIVDKLWGKDVFVDVETGVHTAARKIRQALGDSTESPRYLETVPGKGYRFIAPVELAPPPAASVRASRGPIAVAAGGAAVLAAAAIWMWFAAPRAVAHVTVAVLPFVNLTGDPAHEYVADGLAEETIAVLGQIDPEHLGVIGRTSMMTYKGTRQSLADIGREVSADYLVESSIQAETGRLRVTSKLIRARDQVQVWAASYDREPTSMLTMQRELSAAIAEQVRLRLSPDRIDALARRHTGNAEAYDLYLRGLNFANQRTPNTTQRAVEYFERATVLDPDYAMAWSGVSMALAASPINGDARPLDVRSRARAAAEQAMRADPALAQAQLSSAYVNWIFEWNWPAAEAEFRRAVTLDPALAPAQYSLGHLLSQTGRHSEAQSVMRRARQLDPLYAMSHALSSQVAFQARDYQAAVEHARQAIVVDAEFWIGHMTLGQAQEQLGDHALAIEALTLAARFSGNNSKAMATRAHMLARTGKVQEAREILRTLEAVSRERYVPPYAIALVYAGLGEDDAVFRALDHAYAERDVHLIFLPADPKWDRYRDDPRFKALLARCNFMRDSAATARTTQ